MNSVHQGPLINCDEVIVGQQSDGGTLGASQSSSLFRSACVHATGFVVK